MLTLAHVDRHAVQYIFSPTEDGKLSLWKRNGKHHLCKQFHCRDNLFLFIEALSVQSDHCRAMEYRRGGDIGQYIMSVNTSADDKHAMQ